MGNKEISINKTIYKHYIENYYISNSGSILNIQFDNTGDIISIKKLKPFKTNFGHIRVEIRINKKPKKILIHRAVYEVWCGDLKEGMVIEHLDSDPSNNHYLNLKQSTQAENIQTAIFQGTFYQAGNDTNILVYDKLNNTKKSYNSIKDFFYDIKAPQYMINHGGLSCLNKRKEYKDRFIIEKIGRKGRSLQTTETVA